MLFTITALQPYNAGIVNVQSLRPSALIPSSSIQHSSVAMAHGITTMCWYIESALLDRAKDDCDLHELWCKYKKCVLVVVQTYELCTQMEGYKG